MNASAPLRKPVAVMVTVKVPWGRGLGETAVMVGPRLTMNRVLGGRGGWRVLEALGADCADGGIAAFHASGVPGDGGVRQARHLGRILGGLADDHCWLGGGDGDGLGVCDARGLAPG